VLEGEELLAAVSVQAPETLKALLGVGETLAGRLLLDALAMEWRTLKLRRDPKCPVCAAAARSRGGPAGHAAGTSL
jgi:adenylyltransferase/sulfurtransferase